MNVIDGFRVAVQGSPLNTGSVYSRSAFTAIASQTTYVANYTVGSVQVFVNGTLLETSAYTATTGSTVVLNTPSTAGDKVDIISYNPAGGIFQLPLTYAYGGTGNTAAPTNGQLLIGNGTGFALNKLTAGANVTITNTAGGITIAAANPVAPIQTYTRTTNIATANQTTFATAYTVNYLQVYINGVFQSPSDYTATDGASFTLSTGCAAGDIVETIAFTPFSTTAGPLAVSQGGTGVTTLSGYVFGNGTSVFTASATIPTSVLSGTVAISQGGTSLSTAPANGQLLIGNGTGYTLATLTAGSGISVTNGSGTISISSSGVSSFSAGTTGLTPNTATSGAITLAGTLAVANGGTGVTTSTGTGSVVLSASPALTGNPTVAGTVVMGSSFLRNRIINGAMQIAQRGTSFTSVNGYTLDRWAVFSAGTFVNAAQISGPAGFSYALQITGVTGNTQAQCLQRIESYNIADLAGTTVTLSVTMQASSAQTVQWTAYYPTSADNYTGSTLITNGTFSVTTTATRFTTQISLPSNVANGLQIAFCPNNAGAFTSGTLTITGVQLEAGSVATPFEFKSVGDTVMLCQRYYQTGSFGVFNYTTGGTQLAYQQPFPVQMRASPSMTQPTATAVNVTSYTLYPGAASFQVYCVGVAASGGAYYGTYTASAEL